MSLDFAKLLESLKHLPLTLLAALSAVGLFVLYGPHIPGMDMSAARKWGWIAPATLFAILLFLFRLIDEVLKSYVRVTAHNPQPSLRLTVHSQINTTWWGHNTPDNPPQTQIAANISAYNPTEVPIRITAVRLIKPSVPVQKVQPIMFIVSNDHVHGGSRQNPVPPHENANIHLTILMAVNLGRPGKFIHARMGLTDQNGYEHKVNVRLWPMPTPQLPQQTAGAAAKT